MGLLVNFIYKIYLYFCSSSACILEYACPKDIFYFLKCDHRSGGNHSFCCLIYGGKSQFKAHCTFSSWEIIMKTRLDFLPISQGLFYIFIFCFSMPHSAYFILFLFLFLSSSSLIFCYHMWLLDLNFHHQCFSFLALNSSNYLCHFFCDSLFPGDTFKFVVYFIKHSLLLQ